MIGVLVIYALTKLQYVAPNEVIVSRTKRTLLVIVKFGKRCTFPIKRGSFYCPIPVTSPSVDTV